jgi:hypothetical protein
VSVPPNKADARLLVTATLSVLVAGVLVAVVLLFATGRGGSPTKVQPFAAGLASAIRSELRDGGPYYFPDPFGKKQSILFALENGKIVALATQLPGTTDCLVKWKASLDRFVDCHGVRHTSEELDRYQSYVEPEGENKGILFVDLRHKLPAPQAAAGSGSSAG